MDTRDAAADRKKEDGRGRFEKFVEAVNGRVSRAPFFIVILGIIVAWLLSYPLFSSGKNWQYVIHTISSVISLLLLVLLENAGRRSQESVHEKLNVIAGGLAALMKSEGRDDAELRDAEEKLSEAIGLEQRH